MSLFASRTLLAVLVGANVLLVAALALSSSPRQAQAGFGGGSYSLVVGQSNGLSQETVYVVDSESGKVFSVVCNPSTRKLEIYGSRDLNKDLNEKGGRAK